MKYGDYCTDFQNYNTKNEGKCCFFTSLSLLTADISMMYTDNLVSKSGS